MSNDLFTERPTKRKGKERAAYLSRAGCPECKGKGKAENCIKCSRPNSCKDCGDPITRAAHRCQNCSKKTPGNLDKGGIGAWKKREAKIQRSKEAKNIDYLSATGGRVLSKNDIVQCYYYRPKRLNILAWTTKEARSWAKKNKLEVSEIVSSVCRVCEINVDLTGTLDNERTHFKD